MLGDGENADNQRRPEQKNVDPDPGPVNVA